MPLLTGETYSDAQAQLQAEGLAITIGPPTPTNNPALSGLIIGAVAGSELTTRPGNSVTVSLGELNSSATTTTTTTLPAVTTLPTTPSSLP